MKPTWTSQKEILLLSDVRMNDVLEQPRGSPKRPRVLFLKYIFTLFFLCKEMMFILWNSRN